MALIFPDVFRPYVEGREAAIAANWADRDKFEKVRAGQLENLFQGGSLDARLRQEEGKAQNLELGNVFSSQTLPTRVAQEEARLGFMGAQTRGLETSTTSEELRQPYIPQREEAGLGLTGAQTEATTAGARRTVELTPSEVRRSEAEALRAEETIPAFVQNEFARANLTTAQAQTAMRNARVADATELDAIATARNEAQSAGLQVDALQLRNELARSMNPLQIAQTEEQLTNMIRNNDLGDATFGAEIRRISAVSGMTETQAKAAAWELAFQQETAPDRRRILRAQADRESTNARVEELTSQYKVMEQEVNARMAKLQLDMAEEMKGINRESAEARLIQQKYANEMAGIELDFNKKNLGLRQFERKMDVFGRINRGEADPVLQQAIKDETGFLWRWWNNDLSPVQQYIKLHPGFNPLPRSQYFSTGPTAGANVGLSRSLTGEL